MQPNKSRLDHVDSPGNQPLKTDNAFCLFVTSFGNIIVPQFSDYDLPPFSRGRAGRRCTGGTPLK